MTKELTEKKVREIVMEGNDAILVGLESYATKEFVEKKILESEERISTEIRESEKRIVKAINNKGEVIERRVYKLEDEVFHKSS